MGAPSAVSASDMTIAGDIDLYLFRDGKSPAVQAGTFGQTEAGRAGGNQEIPIMFDRLDGGLGSTERLIPNTYLQTIDGCTRFSRAWTPGGKITRLGALPNGAGGRPAGRIRSITEHGDDLLIGAGGVLYRLVYPYETANLTVEHTVHPTEEIERIIVYNNILVIGTRFTASGAPGRLHVKVGTTWIRSPTGDLAAHRQFLCQAYFTITDVGRQRLAANDTPNTFRFIDTTEASDLLDDSAWIGINGVYPVGDGTHPITNIVGGPLVMYHLTTNGLWQVQEDGRSACIAGWSDAIHPMNGTQALFMYGGVYASHGRVGLVRVDVANMQTQWATQACEPGSGYPRVTPIHGSSNALTSDGEWLVDAVYNGTDSFVCYARPNELAQRVMMSDIKSPSQHNWHGSEATFWNQEVTCLQQASIGPSNRPLLWVGGIENGVTVLQHVSLPKLATPLEDYHGGGPHRFATESWLYLPREDFGGDDTKGWASVKKVFSRVELTALHLERYSRWIDVFMNTSSTGHDIFYNRALEGEAALWNQIGRMDHGDRASLVPGSSVQSGRAASLMFHGYSEEEIPFAWYGAKLRGVPLLEQSERRRYRVVVGKVRRPNRSLVTGDREIALNRLWNLQWSDPVSLRDHTQTNIVIQVEEGMRYEEVQDSNREWVTAVTFGCRILRRPFFWGSAARWGSDVTWS